MEKVKHEPTKPEKAPEKAGTDVGAYMSYSLNSLKGDYIGDNYGGY